MHFKEYEQSISQHGGSGNAVPSEAWSVSEAKRYWKVNDVCAGGFAKSSGSIEQSIETLRT